MNSDMIDDSDDILNIRSLSVHFPTGNGVFKALDGLDFSLKKNEVLGLIGQSGSGKTLTATAIMGMVEPPGRIVSGSVCMNGRDLSLDSASAMKRIRGRDIFMIFQSPGSVLNPTLKIGLQLSEIMVHRHGMNWKEARICAADCLERVRLSRDLLAAYPFELSGGMQQRVLIAMALAARPRVLIADEPTTGLDAVTQMKILDLFGRLREEIAEAVLFISHDLRVLLKLSDRIAVMYAGRIVETTPADRLLKEAAHPRTREILSAFYELESGGGKSFC